jgi:hypothetical protein
VSTLEDWTAAVVAELGLDPADVDQALVLDLARDVAHAVARPAAPLTAFLVGLAAGRSGQAPDVVAARVVALAGSWPGGTDA